MITLPFSRYMLAFQQFLTFCEINNKLKNNDFSQERSGVNSTEYDGISTLRTRDSKGCANAETAAGE